MKTFNVLLYKNNKVEYYDVLPYLIECWKDKKDFDNEMKYVVKESNYPENKRKYCLKAWIENKARYMFWARCEYELLLAPWPFGSYRINQDLKNFLTSDFNIEDYSQNIAFYNIIIQDMKKIDVYEQIMMNIDVIVDILWEEIKDGK